MNLLSAIKNPVVSRIILAAAVFLAAVALYQAMSRAVIEQHGSSYDLFKRYYEVRLMFHGENPYRLQVEDRLSQRASEVFGPDHQLDPDYFPSALLPILPVAAMPRQAAKVAWLLITLGSIVLLLKTLHWMMGQERPPPLQYALAVCLWIAGSPVWVGIGLGQNAIFSLALTLAAFRESFRGRDILAGGLLALGVFKYALVWPIVLFFFIFQGRWRCLLTAGGIHLAAHLLLCRIMGAHPVTVFADVLRGNSGVFHRNDVLTVWLPFRVLNERFPALGLPAQLLGAILLMALIAGLAWLWFRRHRDDECNLLAWTAALTLLAVFSVTLRIYTHVYALPVLLLAFVPISSRGGSAGRASLPASHTHPGSAGASPSHCASLPVISLFQRSRLAFYIVYLTLIHRGLEWAFPGQSQHLLLIFNAVLAVLAVELTVILSFLEKPAVKSSGSHRSPAPVRAFHPL